MLSWQVGAVKITCVVEMVFPLPHDPQGVFFRDATPEALKASLWLYPHFANEDGSLNMSIDALLVEAPGLKLMVDTCVGNDKLRSVTGGNPLTTSFLQHLMDAGWSRDSVDAVICTHLHVDHVGGGQVDPDLPVQRLGCCMQVPNATSESMRHSYPYIELSIYPGRNGAFNKPARIIEQFTLPQVAEFVDAYVGEAPADQTISVAPFRPTFRNASDPHSCRRRRSALGAFLGERLHAASAKS